MALSFQDKIKSVGSDLSFADKIKEVEVQPEVNKDTQSAEIFKPNIPSETGQGLLSAAGKYIANIPTGLWGLGKGILEFLNPVNTVKTVQQLGTDVGTMIEEKKQGQPTPSFTDFLKEIPSAGLQILPKAVQDTYTAIKSGIQGKQPEMDAALQELERTLVNDPSQALQVYLVARGIAEPLGYGKTFDVAFEKATKPILENVKKTTLITKKAGEVSKKVAGETAKFTTAQVTGLSPETITQVLAKPEAFTPTEMAKVNRGTLSERVKTALDLRLDYLSDTGKGYDIIRKIASPVEIEIPKIQEIFNKYGIKFGDDGKILRTPETAPLKTGDISALEDFYSLFGKEEYLSPNAFLNARKTLSNLAQYEATKSDVSKAIARELRYTYDQFGKEQIKGLKEVDEKYAPEVELLGKLKKDYLNADGTLKDGALNKIANLKGKGKEKTLSRLEELTPGIGEDISILKAIEDIEFSRGQKVGTYIRAGLSGGFVVAGNIPLAIISILLAQPSVAIAMLRQFAALRGFKASVIETIINKMRTGAKLNVKEENIVKATFDNATSDIENTIKNDSEINPSLAADIEYRIHLSQLKKEKLLEKDILRDEEIFKARNAEEFLSFDYNGFNSEMEYGYQNFKNAVKKNWRIAEAEDTGTLKKYKVDTTNMFEGKKLNGENLSNDDILDLYKKRLKQEREFAKIAKQKTSDELIKK